LKSRHAAGRDDKSTKKHFFRKKYFFFSTQEAPRETKFGTQHKKMQQKQTNKPNTTKCNLLLTNSVKVGRELWIERATGKQKPKNPRKNENPVSQSHNADFKKFFLWVAAWA
jgi:hypothetical protein